MKREQRQLRQAKRQHLIAEVARRMTMRSLAEALAEADRSADLATRSRTLASDYTARAMDGSVGPLVGTAQFTAALAKLADEADLARANAAQQAGWQGDALAQARNKADRHRDRVERARLGLETAHERRFEAQQLSTLSPKTSALARNMQSTTQTNQSDQNTAAKPASRRKLK